MKKWSFLMIVTLLFANITHAQNPMNPEQRAKQQTAQLTTDLKLKKATGKSYRTEQYR
nr:hypothetical protein [uncultured Carboxylicivirga sp.]